jgi:hypothetical protein
MHPQSFVYLDPHAPAPVWSALIAVAVFLLAAFASAVVPEASAPHVQPAADASVSGPAAA